VSDIINKIQADLAITLKGMVERKEIKLFNIQRKGQSHIIRLNILTIAPVKEINVIISPEIEGQ
jgi:hypothetical protein